MIARATPALSSHYATAIKLAEAADAVRGYEDVKLGNIDAFRAEAARLLEALEGAPDSRKAA